MYLVFQGYSHIEYKSLMDHSTKVLRKNQNSEYIQSFGEEKKGQESSAKYMEDYQQSETLPKVLFKYDFEDPIINYAKVFKTKSYILGFLFADLADDKDLRFNGTEWTTIYFFQQLARIASKEQESEEEPCGNRKPSKDK
mmetsp:Transcript_42474/g.40721  ORF Transcript_42474/g.40721 Transcript_42474/m.40721 type:complete len:140 (+) Transcript_42474:806-1225(+)